MRIGFASDIHRLVEGRRLILAGVVVPFELGEEAHSDGAVVYHAVAESILGALALGDLGKHFPDTDPKYKGISSLLLLEEVAKMMSNKGYQINNIDIQVACAKPKLAPYVSKMRDNLSKVLKTSKENVSIKAMSFNKVGAIGRGEAIRSQAIVMLTK